MKLLSYKRLTFFLLFLFFAVPVHTKSKTWGFYLQPFSGVEVFVKGKKLKTLSRVVDKEIGFISMEKPDTSFTLTVKLADGSITTSVDTSAGGDILIQKIGKKYRRVGYYKTGEKPKSATFLTGSLISIPLLDAEGIRVIDAEGSKNILLDIPKKYVKKPGFVETVVLPDLGEFWVSQMSSQVHVFDLKTLKYKTTITVSGKWSKFMIYDAARKKVYLSNWISGDITVIDAKEKKEKEVIKTGDIPRGLLLSSDGKSLYVTIYSDLQGDAKKGKLLAVNLKTKKIKKISLKPGAKRHIVSDGNGKIYVSDMLNSTVEVIDESKLKVVKTIAVFSKPNTIAVSPDGKFLYVSCRGPNNKESYLLKGPELGKIIIIDIEKMATVKTIPAGNQPTGLAVSPDGRFLATTDFLDHRLRVYPLQNGLPFYEEGE